MKVKKIVCAALAAVICLMLGVGCAYNPEVVMTIDGTEISSGLYLYYQQSAIQEAHNLYNDYDEDDEYLTGAQFIDDKSLMVEGVPVRDWIDNRTMTLIKEHVLIENEFERLDLSFPANLASYNDNLTSTDWESNYALMQKNGISYDTFKLAYDNTYKKEAVMTALYEKGGELEIPKEDYVTYFEENYTRVDYMQFGIMNNLTGEYLSPEDIEKVAGIAEQMTEKANEHRGGLETAYFELYGSVATLLGDSSELTSEHFATVASLDYVIDSENATLHKDFVAGVFEVDAEDHEYKYFYDETSYVIIVYRVNGLHEDDEYTSYESTIRKRLADEPFEEYITSKTSVMTVDIDKRAKKYYSVDKARLS